MLVKVPLILVLLYVYIQSNSALLCASIWGVVIFVFGVLLGGGLSLPLFMGTGISFLIAMGYFSLLDYLDGVWWWTTMILGMGLLILI